MGFLDAIFKRNSELEFLFDMELFEDKAKRLHMKKLAIETCISFIGRTISQSEFRVKNGDTYIKDELYYRLNVRPSKNVTASTFWQTFIYQYIFENECLIIQADEGDLLIADSFTHKEYAVFDDIFSNVVVKDFEFKRTFKQSEVIHLRYGNEKLTPLIDSLFTDYGDLFGSVLKAQKRKNQIRGTVDMDMTTAKTEEEREKLKGYINKLYDAFEKKDIAIVPQQKGVKYEEVSSNGLAGQSVDEINKVTNGFLDQIAFALGIPISLLRGDMADVEKQTKNYMFFTIAPLLKKIKDEANVKFFTQKEYLAGQSIEIRKASYRDIFDLATSIDKLKSSGFASSNELRDVAGWERVDDPIMDAYFVTKNYQESSEALKGGENE